MKFMLHVLYISIIAALLTLVRMQGQIITVQRGLIREMAQNPSCSIP